MARGAILGLDILPGESPERGDARYAASILVGGEVVKRLEVRRSELPSIFDRYRVEMVAVDNIYELGASKEDIAELLTRSVRIPRLVQVNVIGGKEYGIAELAESLGLSEGGKLSPSKTSEVAARLAYLGIGSEVLLFEEETRVVVSRGRSATQGGMSRERYRRNIDAQVLRVTKEIREALDKSGIDYDLFYRRSSSVFVVYAPRRKLYGVVRPFRTKDVHVTVVPITRDSIEYVPLYRRERVVRARKDRYLIVGVDPGVSTGLAALTLDGRPVLLMSKRWLSRNQITRILSQHGRALVIATDSNPPPSFVKKLAAMLNAVLYVPKQSLPVGEKREMVSRFLEGVEGFRISDSHQRDALAAALKAYYSFENKFRQVDAQLRSLGLAVPASEVKALVVRGATVKGAIERMLKSRVKCEVPPARMPERSFRERVEMLEEALEQREKVIEELESRVHALYEENEKLRTQIGELEEALERIISARGMLKSRIEAALESKTEYLAERLREVERELEEALERERRWREVVRLALEGSIARLPVLRTLTPSGIAELLEREEVRGKVLYVVDATSGTPDAVERLAKEGVEGLVVGSSVPDHLLEALKRSLIPVVGGEEVGVFEVGGEYFADRKELSRSLRARRKELERAWREEFEKLIESYRLERRRELGGRD